MDTSHFYVTPSTIGNAILTQFTTIKRSGSSGFLATVGRVSSQDAESIKMALAPGVPALLLFYGGGVFDHGGAGKQRWQNELHFSVLCVSSRSVGDNVLERMTSGDVDTDNVDPTDNTTMPGVEELQDWAVWLGVRGMRNAAALQPRPGKNSQVFRISPGVFIGSVDLYCRRLIDVYDDALATSLEKLGIVHSPEDPDDLWEVDNVTPKSEWPPTTDGGVVTL